MTSKIRTCFLFLLIGTLPISILVGQNMDIRVLREINLGRNTSLDPAFRAVTQSVAPVCIGTPVIMLGIGYFNKDSMMIKNALYTGATLLTSIIISNILKYSVNRTRPYDKYPYIEKATPVHSPSFPSGHTSNSFALATSVSLSYPKWYVVVPSYAWAATVAYSRMDLGVHYPSDVLIGAFIGTGSAFLCYKLNRKLKIYR